MVISLVCEKLSANEQLALFHSWQLVGPRQLKARYFCLPVPVTIIIINTVCGNHTLGL